MKRTELYLIRRDEQLAEVKPSCSLFFCAIPSEERGTVAAGKVPFAPNARAIGLDFRFADGLPVGGNHRMDELVDALGEVHLDVHPVRLYDTAYVAELLATEVGPDDAVWLDFTSFPTPELGIVFRQLRDMGLVRLISTYTFPLDYPAWRNTPTRLHAASGEPIAALEGFGGLNEGKERLLIVQLGFEGQRALGVVTDVEAQVLPVLGFPPLRPGWDQRSRTENVEILRRSGGRLERAPADDVIANRIVIDRITRELGEKFDISILPLGTKPQTVGAILHALRRPATRLIYDFPAGPAADYSTGFGPTLAYELALPAATDD